MPKFKIGDRIRISAERIRSIRGDGPARAELERMMPGAVFLGHVGGKDLSETYASSDILVFPSTNETFGNVTVEAMASGLVPIVADAGGSRHPPTHHFQVWSTCWMPAQIFAVHPRRSLRPTTSASISRLM